MVNARVESAYSGKKKLGIGQQLMTTDQKIKAMIQQAREQGWEFVFDCEGNRLKEFIAELPDPVAWKIVEATGHDVNLKQFLEMKLKSWRFYRDKKEHEKRKTEVTQRNPNLRSSQPTVNQRVNDLIDYLKMKGERTVYVDRQGKHRVVEDLADLPLNLAFEVHYAVENDRALSIGEFQQAYKLTRVDLDLEEERTRPSKNHPLSGLPIKGRIRVFKGGRADGNSR